MHFFQHKLISYTFMSQVLIVPRIADCHLLTVRLRKKLTFLQMQYSPCVKIHKYITIYLHN